MARVSEKKAKMRSLGKFQDLRAHVVKAPAHLGLAGPMLELCQTGMS